MREVAIYARGRYDVGKEVIDQVEDQIRKQAESISNLQGYLLVRSLGGGTGSGLTPLFMKRRGLVMDFSVYPAPDVSSAIVEPYNAVLTTHAALEKSEDRITFVVDNQAVYDICRLKLDVEKPSYTNLNYLIAQVVSSITTPLRFEGDSKMDLRGLENIAPLPRMRFLLSSYAPLIPVDKSYCEQPTVENLINACFDPANSMVKCDLGNGKYLTYGHFCRGDVVTTEIQAAIEKTLRLRQSTIKCIIDFNWVSRKIYKNDQLPTFVPGGDLAKVQRCFCMLSNTTAIAQVWARLRHKFDLMYAKRAFVHWYIG